MLRFIFRPLRQLLRKSGYDIVRLPPGGAPADVRMRWMNRLGVDLVIDVGANQGHFVGWMRGRGYDGSILSFEPQRDAYEACEARWKDDPNWSGIRTALGEADAELELHIAGNSFSSSLRPMLGRHVEALPESAIVRGEMVPVTRLDAAIPERLDAAARRIYLKVDTQGYEDTVLAGATGIMDRVALIELELSLVPLYEGQALMPEMMDKVAALGFVPIAMEQGFASTVDGRLLQVDCIFARADWLD
ncbi:MAG: FkbM family methyltransferase [Rhizobiaceae bacterium]